MTKRGSSFHVEHVREGGRVPRGTEFNKILKTRSAQSQVSREATLCSKPTRRSDRSTWNGIRCAVAILRCPLAEGKDAIRLEACHHSYRT
jgi:hypothetical protein